MADFLFLNMHDFFLLYRTSELCTVKSAGCVCVRLTSGVKRNLIPLTEPLSVSPLIRKMVRTRYGSVEVTYTA